MNAKTPPFQRNTRCHSGALHLEKGHQLPNQKASPSQHRLPHTMAVLLLLTYLAIPDIEGAKGAEFTSPVRWSASYGYAGGWLDDTHPRVLADVDGDDRDDVVGFSDDGVYVSLSTGTAAQPVGSELRLQRHCRWLACRAPSPLPCGSRWRWP